MESKTQKLWATLPPSSQISSQLSIDALLDSFIGLFNDCKEVTRPNENSYMGKFVTKCSFLIIF